MILLVDDDKRSLRPYCEELEERGFTCRLCGSVDEALGAIQASTAPGAAPIELIVWDMMMPPGKAFAELDTKAGLITGAFFYSRFRSMLPNVPSFLFTNLSLSGIEGPFIGGEAQKCCGKEELLPRELADEVEKLLRSARAS